MTEKEKINWQFVDQYYPYFVKKMQLIDAHMVFQNYEIVFEELYTAFIHINEEVLKDDKTKTTHQEFMDKAQVLEDTILRLRREEVKDLFSIVRLKKQTKLKKEIQKQSRELYMVLMGLVSDLNMFFPKVKQDGRLPIYK